MGSSPSVSTILHSSVGIRAQVFVSMGKLVTRYCLAIEIISSSLIGGPINLVSLVRVQLQKPVAIVQLKRTPVYETGGREFKSLIPDQPLKEFRIPVRPENARNFAEFGWENRGVA